MNNVIDTYEINNLQTLQFKSLASSIKEGVVLINLRQEITWANESACEVSNYKVSELVGKKVADVLHMIGSDDLEITSDQLCPIGGIDMEGVIFSSANASLVDRKGTVKVVNVQSKKIRDGSKMELGALVILENVFKEGELERMKSDFVSMAVHMLRTPLTVIKGYLTNLLDLNTVRKLDRAETDNLASAIAGTEELDMLVENLLHLSEIQSGSFRIYPTPISYEGLVATVVNEFKPAVEAKGLKLFYIPPMYELSQMRLDFARIKEVLRNIIDNAIKYTDNGGIEVNVNREGDQVHTTIKDTGKGIPTQNLDYIFTKFYRIKDPLEMQEGLGLGLFIAKKIVEAHRGKIWAESVEGEGSVFHILLPITQ